MSHRFAIALVAAALAVGGPGCTASKPEPAPPVVVAPPAQRPAPRPEPPAAPPDPMAGGTVVPSESLAGPAREFRGAWIATVANIDWPSRPGLPTDDQQAELVALLDQSVALGLNAVVLQVRPTADALYASALEPWSGYLTGRQGREPDPWYDPLQFAVDAAHERGLELHAWFNPYRAGHPSGASRMSPDHVARRRPDLVRRYGDYLWLDPGEPDAVDHSLRVILDVVRRYDVDGVHLDDYFYPYPVTARGRRVAFPDAESYERARQRGETLGRDDWRRQNVDRFIERLYREVKDVKPWVKVGISPFGIWRPGNPAGVTGFDQFAEIYADARRWQQEGWLDYLAPQLYWAISSRGQSFPALLDWWGEQNTAGRHLWPGLYDSRTLPDVGGYKPREIVDQVELVRADPEATGTVHFSIKALLPGPSSLGADLAAGPYAEPALVPASPWLDAEPPAPPGLRVQAGRAMWAEGSLEPVRHWVVRTRAASGAWDWSVRPRGERSLTLGPDVRAVAVSAVDRVGNEGPARVVEVE